MPHDFTAKKLYEIVDSFLVEAKDQNGNDRSLERLNTDRHLAIKKLLELLAEARTEGYHEGYREGIAEFKNGKCLHKNTTGQVGARFYICLACNARVKNKK